MENVEYKKTVQEFSTSDFSESLFQEDLKHEGDGGKEFMTGRPVSEVCNDDSKVKQRVSCLNILKSMTPTDFGSHFQDVVIQALLQSTGGVIGSTSSMQSSQENLIAKVAVIPKVENCVPSTWNESAYNKFEAQRNKSPMMTRTSVGEGTDSQEDFPIPENKSPHERSICMRRLNRSRARKAKELTSN